MTSTPTSSSAARAGDAPDPLVLRFDVTERLFHWAFAVPFLLTMVTGLAMYFDALQKLAGDRELVRDIHRFAGLAVVVLPVLVLVIGRRRGLARDLDDLDLWSYDDRLWFRAWVWRKLGGRDPLPPQGRFNAGQKVNAAVSAAGIVILSVTGIVIFPGIHPPFELVSNSRALHNITWMVLTLAVAGHVFLAAVYPPTRPGLGGAFGGRVRLSWLRHHHPLTPEALAQEPGDEAAPGRR
ncbi:MAG: formate dehydrogenase subunit gamma [Chloroflexota bacterium]|jgi:formate dehydrogenase subunit gamma|nr:formate dehydrogenase subunit gamma [Chloroflexota bacterium]